MGHSGQGGGRAGEPVGRRALLGRPSAPGARLRQVGSWMEEEEEEEKEAGATQREERASERAVLRGEGRALGLQAGGSRLGAACPINSRSDHGVPTTPL